MHTRKKQWMKQQHIRTFDEGKGVLYVACVRRVRGLPRVSFHTTYKEGRNTRQPFVRETKGKQSGFQGPRDMII
jgi:hypothetical protein